MGVLINLTGASFDRIRWRRELGDVAYTGAEGEIAPFCVGQLEPDEADLILFDGESREASADAEVWLLPMGGIRGVTVKNSPEGITLSMPTCAGARDWELATALAKRGRACGAVMDVDGEMLAPGEAADLGKWQSAAWESDHGSLRALAASGQDELALPLVARYLHLELTRAQVEAPTLHDDLVARVRCFSEAHWASTMAFETPDGTALNLNVAGGVPTMIERNSDGVVLYDEPLSMDAKRKPLFGGEPVPTARYLELMGDRVESAGAVVYVPLMTYSRMPDIFPQLQAAAEAGCSGTPQGRLEGSQVLATGPILVFMMIAAADGTVDKKEAAAFQTLLQNGEMAPGEIFQTMLRDARENFVGLIGECAQRGVPAQVLFVKMLQALDQCPEQEALLARQGLYALGHAIASASGGFLGFGSKIGRAEREALDMLRAMLGVNPDDFLQS